MTDESANPTAYQMKEWYKLSPEARKKYSPSQMPDDPSRPAVSPARSTDRTAAELVTSAKQAGEQGMVVASGLMTVKNLRRTLIILAVLCGFLSMMALVNPNFLGTYHNFGSILRSRAVYHEEHGMLEGSAGGFAAASAALLLAATWTLRLDDNQRL